VTPWWKGLVIAVVHLALVGSLGAKLLYDRETRPRVWALTTPYDPDLPIRGRYVSLQVAVEPRGFDDTDSQAGRQPRRVFLRAEAGRLVADAKSDEGSAARSDLFVRFIQRGGESLAVLQEPVAFFIPEHVPDPSRRAPDEHLWVEVTIPKKGPPRPIRLGVKKGDGPIEPLDL
jgi:hypothetical protein